MHASAQVAYQSVANFTTRPGAMGHEMSKQILILAATNGAGKTTLAREFLTTEANCPTFLNADIIAAELPPDHPERASPESMDPP
jgi:hypothetical protein